MKKPPPRVEVAIGVAVGVFSGVFGVGGGILLVPIMVSWLGMTRKPAHATSLVAVVLLSFAGTVSYACSGEVSWVAAGLLIAGGMVGAPMGAALLRRVSDRWLGFGFGLFLIVVAVGMALGISSDNEGIPDLTLGAGVIFLITGVLAGSLSALLGVGGGVIMIPALALAGGFGQHLAEGTALAAMGPIAAIGAIKLTFGANSYPDWPRGVRLGLGGVIGAPLGAAVALALPATILQRAFAVLVLITAAQLIYKMVSSNPRPADGISELPRHPAET